MQATFVNHSTGQPTTIDLRGDFWGGSGDLTVEGGPTVAQITRQLMNMRQVFTDNQTVRDHPTGDNDGETELMCSTS
jgi:hypothetical protein